MKKENEVIFTKHELFMAQAPNTNFEYDADQLLKKALEVGFVNQIGDDQYKMNNNYGVK
jgi:molybdopterin-biosynthesis enzyme MoeA-like protein